MTNREFKVALGILEAGGPERRRGHGERAAARAVSRMRGGTDERPAVSHFWLGQQLRRRGYKAPRPTGAN